MRVLEHRRHSYRDPSSTHLSPDGVALARRVGRGIGRFDRVVTSPKPRAVETAEALGFPDPEVLPGLGEMPDEVGMLGEKLELGSFAEYVHAVLVSEVARGYADEQLSLWADVLDDVPDGARVLMVSHAGVIEYGAAAAAPEVAPTWGAPLGYLEGVRLGWEKGRWTHAEVLRV